MRQRGIRLRRMGWVVLPVVLAMVAAVLFHAPMLTLVADALKRDCSGLPAGGSDAIIVLGGELDGARTRKAAELYKQGFGERVMLSDGTRLSWRTMAIDEMYDLAVRLGVPQTDILKEDRSRSTYENALYTKEMMLQEGMTSAIVVTSDWHAARSQFIFEKVYRGSGISLFICGTPDEHSDLAEWWNDAEKQQTVLTELAKTVVYRLKYTF